MLGLGSGPEELIIVEQGWMLATKQDPLPPSGPAACEMKREEELEEGLSFITFVCVIRTAGWTTTHTNGNQRRRPHSQSSVYIEWQWFWKVYTRNALGICFFFLFKILWIRNDFWPDFGGNWEFLTIFIMFKQLLYPPAEWICSC